MNNPFDELLEAGFIAKRDDYTGPLAESYDAIEGRRSEDLAFYRSFWSEPARIIDLGCGSGRVSEVLLAQGHTVTAIDQSADMLALLENRIADKERLRSLHDSMEWFSVDDPVDAVVISYNGFYNMNTAERRRLCVRSAFQALLPGGKLIIDVDLYDPERNNDGFYSQVVPGGDGYFHVFVDFAQMDPQTGIRSADYLCLTLNKDGRYVGSLTKTKDAIPRVPDIKELLVSEGFEIEAFYGDYQGTRLRDMDKKQRLIAVAIRP